MSSILPSLHKLFAYYKQLGEKAMAQVSDEQLFEAPGAELNSISIIVKHLAGNMRSRFTDFLTSDGEKEWRNRDQEFEGEHADREALMADWESGWEKVNEALNSVGDGETERIVYIRNEGHTVVEALHRQLAHYAYHVGQLVLLARMHAGEKWTSLSIPKGGSKAFNEDKFGADPSRRHFTDEE